MKFLKSKVARHLQVALLLCTVCILFAGCRNHNIVKTKLTDTAGNVLQMEFNNDAGTAVLFFRGDTIFLKQDTMASGIRYSNNQYVYMEWQGQSTLYKDSLIVFNIE